MQVLPARRPQRGFSVIEAIIVVAILGFVAILAVVQINNMWQKARLSGEAGNLAAFLQSAYTFMVNSRAPVYVRLVPGVAGGAAATLTITQYADGHLNADGSGVFATYTAPDFVTLSSSFTDVSALDAATVWPAWPAACPPSKVTTGQNGGQGVLECDTSGRAMAPASGTSTCQAPTFVTAAQTIVMTHVKMVSGSLKPKINYNLQVFPVWKVQNTQKMP